MKYIAKVLIVDSRGRVLLAHRSQSETWDSGLWSLPGGEIERGEQPHDAAQREVQEELGLKVEVYAEPLGTYYYPDNEKAHADVTIYFFRAKRWDGTLSLNPEHTAASWLDKRGLAPLKLSPSARWAIETFILSN